MAKYEVTRFGDEHGIGAIVTVKGWFRTTTWTMLPNPYISGLDKWVCRETGEYQYTGLWKGEYVYKSQYRTKDVQEEE